MIYPYYCSTCQNLVDIHKPHTESSSKELCPDCNLDMERIYTSPLISMNNLEAQYNPAFGKVIHNKGELRETLARYKGETGAELHEVGNDKLSTIKKRYKSYEV